MFRIRIKIGEVEIEAEGDSKEEVETKIEELREQFFDSSSSMQVQSGVSSTIDVSHSISLPEFLMQKHPDSHPDKMLVIAFYLMKFRNKSTFTRADIDSAYSETRISKPANINDVINQNIRKSYVMDAGTTDGAKSWNITMSGEKYVEEMGSKVNA